MAIIGINPIGGQTSISPVHQDFVTMVVKNLDFMRVTNLEPFTMMERVIHLHGLRYKDNFREVISLELYFFEGMKFSIL